MKVTLTEDYGRKKKGESFEISPTIGYNLIKKGVAVAFGTEAKEEKKGAKTSKKSSKAEETEVNALEVVEEPKE